MVRAATSHSPPESLCVQTDKTTHSVIRKVTESRCDRESDELTYKSAGVSYSRSRHERTGYERSSVGRYSDHISESKYRSSGSSYRRSPESRSYRDTGDQEHYRSGSSRSRYHSDLQSYYSSHRSDHNSSHHTNHYEYRSDHYRDRYRRSPSESRKSRSYRDEEYSRYSGPDRDDHRIHSTSSSFHTKSEKTDTVYRTSSSHFSSSSSSSRLKREENRLTHVPHPASPSPRRSSGRTVATRTTFGDWEEHVSSNKKVYYYNKVSGVSQWEKPAEIQLISERSHSDRAGDRRSKSPVADRQRLSPSPVSDESDLLDGYDRKPIRRSTATTSGTREAVSSKTDVSPHSHHFSSSNNIISKSNSNHNKHLESCSSNSQDIRSVRHSAHQHRSSVGHLSRSHSLRRRSCSVQSSSSESSHYERERRRQRDSDVVKSDRLERVHRNMDVRDSALSNDLCRKRKAAELTKDLSHPDWPVINENGLSWKSKSSKLSDENDSHSQRKKVLPDSPLRPHQEPILVPKKKETESFASGSNCSDQNSNSSCPPGQTCLSPSQVTMDNLEKIIDSLADTPGLPDLRKLSREDALKTIRQVLRIMKEASLGIGTATPATVSPPEHNAGRSSSTHNRSKMIGPNNVSGSLVSEHGSTLNGTSGFPCRQDLGTPSPSSEISGYSSNRSPSDSGVDVTAPSKPPVPSISATLASFFKADLIDHVLDWDADHMEKQVRLALISSVLSCEIVLCEHSTQTYDFSFANLCTG